MADGETFWNDTRFRGAVVGGAAALFLLLFVFGFGYELELPPKPPRPKEMTREAVEKQAREQDRDPAQYRSYLAGDARSFGLGPVAPGELARAFEYQVEAEPHVLSLEKGSASSLEAAGLRLTMTTKDTRDRIMKMMVLQIENLTHEPLAYNVVTRPSRGTQPCHQKEDLPHNAIALAPREVVTRTECIYRKDWTLRIEKVETMKLPELSYFYVSKVYPAQIGTESRVARGHKPPSGDACTLILPAVVKRSLESGETTWRDLVDFYARHRCETYMFPMGYRAFERDGERPLPAADELR